MYIMLFTLYHVTFLVATFLQISKWKLVLATTDAMSIFYAARCSGSYRHFNLFRPITSRWPQ